jgi:two-component system, response regulator YesN
MAYQILLVDDDRDFREEMKDLLMDRYKVIESVSGEEALKLLKKPNAIDLVIMDVVMPGLSGTDTLKAIKTIAPDLAVVMLTGRSSKDIAVAALKGRADDYIEKPFDPDQFFRTIDRILSKKDAAGLSGLLNRNKIERVKQYIERNSVRKVNLKDAAQEVCLSFKYLSRTFKEKTGMGFNEYRLNIKMDKAKELLNTTQMSVCDVALKLGYQNPESFIRIFKKKTGSTPAAYKQEHTVGRRKNAKKHKA